MSFSNLCAQINTLITAWRWNSKDTILHTLPLHHVHGIVNGLLTPLHIGARSWFVFLFFFIVYYLH